MSGRRSLRSSVPHGRTLLGGLFFHRRSSPTAPDLSISNDVPNKRKIPIRDFENLRQNYSRKFEKFAKSADCFYGSEKVRMVRKLGSWGFTHWISMFSEDPRTEAINSSSGFVFGLLSMLGSSSPEVPNQRKHRYSFNSHFILKPQESGQFLFVQWFFQ